MHRRVPDVRRDRAHAVLFDDGREQFFAASERLVPGHLPPLVAMAHEWHAETIGIMVQVAERGTFRAEVPLAPRIVAVAADASDAVARGLDLETAHDLAQRTRAVVRADVDGGIGEIVARVGGHPGDATSAWW